MKRLILPVLVGATLAAACGGSAPKNASSTVPLRGGGAHSSGASGSAHPAAAASGSVATVKTATGTAGRFLVDAKGRALYLWVADKGPKSTCSGACAQAWPPLITTAKPRAGKGAKASLLGTTKRSGGAHEVTYAGHPLYDYAGDTKPGQTTGQGSDGFGAKWWLVAPNGKAITRGGS